MTAAAALRGLYVITDARWTPAERLLSAVEAALQGGARLVQYRDKHSPAAVRLAQAQALQALCRDYAGHLIINDDVALCAEVGAAGVHLGQSDTSIRAAREQLGPTALIGATCHNSLTLAAAARAAGASYVAFGRFFASHTKPDAPPARLADIQPGLAGLGIPAAAIGGITLAHAPTLLAAGFALLAVIHDVFARDDIATQCRRYTDIFDEFHDISHHKPGDNLP